MVTALLLMSFLPAQTDAESARNRMVRGLQREGITDARVLDAFRNTPRHEFVPAAMRRLAYVDQALSIGHRQTISPPYIVAYMTQTLEVQPEHRVLEIGTGSGYQAAILSPLAADVYSIEIVEPLGRTAARTLQRQGLENVHTRIGDGYLGWPEAAPFDRIIVTCSPEDVPQPLVNQLAEGGRMIIPLGERYQQVFHLFEKRGGKLEQTRLVPTLFVPMTGRSEQMRDIMPDPRRPSLRNGGFELLADEQPIGWHQVRSATIDGRAANGQRCLKFESTSRGTLSQILQGLALDGREVPKVHLSASYRCRDVRGGEGPAGVELFLFDARRDVIGKLTLPAMAGTVEDWKTVSRTLEVPRLTREAILRVGLNSGTGTLWVDDLSIHRVD